jgi:hypothetical protein
LVGVDIDPGTRQFEDVNTKILVGDQSDPNFLAVLAEQHGPFDIIVDDGGHTMKQQRLSFDNLWKHVAPGGVYLCDDTHTSYWSEYVDTGWTGGSFVEFAKRYRSRNSVSAK